MSVDTDIAIIGAGPYGLSIAAHAVGRGLNFRIFGSPMRDWTQMPKGMLLKSEGLVKRIGVSVYDAAEIDGVLEIFRPDVVQLPLNIFDQRLIQSGHIKALQSAGIEIHARSAFLQGILLSERSALPDYFKRFDGSLAGYYWGLDRKRALLKKESDR